MAFFDIAVKLLDAGASLNAKEWRNNKPFDLFATESLKRRFFMEADFPNRALVNNNHDLWFYLIQLSDMKVSECSFSSSSFQLWVRISFHTISILFENFLFD